MQRLLVVKGRSLGSSSDLSLLAPIKPGFVESLESVTYKTRIKRVLHALHGARMNSHEFSPARLLSDAVERVSAIQSVRVAVQDNDDMVLLAVSFDGSWESYIRVLWHKVGTLLDLIFCNTVDYVTARDHSFDDWEAWARRVQIESGFFYGPPESTARDAIYHRRIERMDSHLAATHDPKDRLLQGLRAHLPSAEEAVRRVVDPPRPLNPDDPQLPAVLQARMVRERVRNGLQGLASLYRLTDLFRPGTADGTVLRAAAIDLLDEFVRMRDAGLIDEELAEERDGPQQGPIAQRTLRAGRFAREIDWLFQGPQTLIDRQALPLDKAYRLPQSILGDVQAGILSPYPRVNAGLVVLLAFDSRDAAAAFLDALSEQAHAITPDAELRLADAELGSGIADRVYRHVSFTAAGLRAVGLDEDELELFSEEFRQGMSRRAGLLGDVHVNHPRRWRLPRRFDQQTLLSPAEGVDLDGVHAVLQLRCLASRLPADAEAIPTALQAELDHLQLLRVPPRILAVQSLRRYYCNKPERDPNEVITEHFGFADGDGQPEIEWGLKQGEFKRNRVPLGEVLLGHANAAEKPLDAQCPHVQQLQHRRLAWQANGSYLVMRKYRQRTALFRESVQKTAQQMVQVLHPTDGSLECLNRHVDIVLGKLMGRKTNGRSVIASANPNRVNAFTYDLDANGVQCPLHAHVRRAHPRARPDDQLRPPRLMRRSMSFGPAAALDDPAAEEPERGLLFMAYNASLGEQFEVVQRWLVGANSTGSSSGFSCPIVGVATPGLPRHFHFEYEQHEFVVEFDRPAGSVNAFDEPDVTTRLDWGLYLFSPSISVLDRLRERAATASAAVPWQIDRGRQLLNGLLQCQQRDDDVASIAAWKMALEDPESIDRLDSAALWAAIRADHGGLLRTPYGVLVADRAVAADVYLDHKRRYSVCGQLERMRNSFGEIALGMDDSPEYRQLATKINQAIGALTIDDVFNSARDAATRKLDSIRNAAEEQSRKVSDARIQVGFDVHELLDEVLADLCEDWFGIQDCPREPQFARGPTDWAWQPGQPPLYPGHFTALSRYMFQPNPGPMASELGQLYGQALRTAMRELVEQHEIARTTPMAPARSSRNGARQPAPLAKAVFDDAAHRRDPLEAADLMARTMVGVLMGFNPTITGAVLNVLTEWHRDGLFGALRLKLAGATDFVSAQRVLGSAMRDALRMRPMPQIGWRTALCDHRLGDDLSHTIDVRAGDRIVMSIVSGTQQSLADGASDRRLMFGGVRRGPDGTYPTHACPGYDAGIGAVLGALAGLLAWQKCDLLRPGTSAFTFVIEATTAAPARNQNGGRPAGLPVLPLCAQVPKPHRLDMSPPTGNGLILAWGDSWLDFPFPFPNQPHVDLRDWLFKLGYEVPETFCKYSVWPKSSTLAARTGPFCADLDARLLSIPQPVAILLSAGGNDSTGDLLRPILTQPATPTALPFDDARLNAHIAGIRSNYIKIIDDILAVQRDHAAQVPILLHGYDHPIPFGVSANGKTYPEKWLYLPFKEVGVDCRASAEALDKGRRTMAELIGRLNEMLAGLQTVYPAQVHHVDLQCSLAPEDWFDDLHPTPAGFGILAMQIHQRIQSLVRNPAPITTSA